MGKKKSIKNRAIRCAVNYLERNGHDVIDTKWKCPAGTVDIISYDGDTVVFSEVLFSIGAEAGYRSADISAEARSRREEVAASYLTLHPSSMLDHPVRFDAVSLVIVSANEAMLRQEVNIFGRSDADDEIERLREENAELRREIEALRNASGKVEAPCVGGKLVALRFYDRVMVNLSGDDGKVTECCEVEVTEDGEIRVTDFTETCGEEA